MANALYDYGREGFLSGTIAWVTDNIKCVLLDLTNYTVNLSTDQFLSDIPVAARVAISPNLTTKTATVGVADAGDVTFTAVSGASSGALALFQDTGTETSSKLIAYIDTATGLPVTPNGGDIQVTWDNNSNKIFKL